MPLIRWGDVVNKTDETIELEPGESMELGVKMVGDELRLETLPGSDDRFREVSCPHCGQPTVVDTLYDEQVCDWVDDKKSREEGEVCGKEFDLSEVNDD